MAEPRSRRVIVDEGVLRSPLLLQNLSKILSKLRENQKITEKAKSGLTESSLAQIIIALRNVMEQFCGKDAPKPKPITKLPLQALQDYSIDGPLFVMLSFLLEETSRKNMSPEDLLSEKKKVPHLLESIDKLLTKVPSLYSPII